jgi:hypothetical protein
MNNYIEQKQAIDAGDDTSLIFRSGLAGGSAHSGLSVKARSGLMRRKRIGLLTKRIKGRIKGV